MRKSRHLAKLGIAGTIVVLSATLLLVISLRKDARVEAALARLPVPPETSHLGPAFAKELAVVWAKLESGEPSKGFFELGKLYHANEYFDFALQLYEEALAIGGPSRGESLYLTGDAAANRGDAVKAEVCFREALEASPEYGNAALRLAELLEKGGRAPEAMTAYRAALSADDMNPHALLGLARLEFAEGNSKDAIAHLVQLLEASPRFSGANLLLAQILEKTGKPQEAAVFRARVGNGRDAPPEDPWKDALLERCFDMQTLGFVFEDRIKGGAIERAMEVLDRMEAVDPGAWNPHYLRGLAYSQMGQAAVAATHYGAAIERGGDSAVLHEGYVKALQRSGNLDQAVAAGSRAIESGRVTPELFVALGEVAKAQQKAAHAEEMGSRALEMDPFYHGANEFMGRMYWERGDKAKAVPFLEAACRLSSGDFVSRATLGQHFVESGEPGKAIRPWEEALAIAPETEPLKRLLAVAYLRHGNEEARSERWDASLQLYEKALTLEPELEEAHANRLRLLKHLRRDEAERMALEDYLKVRPNSAAAHLSLGDWHARQGDDESAREAWLRAGSLSSQSDNPQLKAALSERLHED